MESKEFKRILAIGDIHGNYRKLLSLWKKVEFNPSEDFLVFLGDYIDRGQSSIQVLNFVRKLKDENPENVVLLRGNHEDMLLKYFKEHDDIWIYPGNGGSKTLKEFQTLGNDKISDIISFVEELPVFYRMEILGKETIFVHAGVMPGIPMEQQSEEDLLWIREDFFRLYQGESLVVVGHTPVQYLLRSRKNPVPLVLPNNIIMLDTGSYIYGGKISCMDILTKKFIQS